jgi:cellulose biosynthesis protein BcsQ
VQVLATFNIKGGVGKSAAAANLAYLSARDGFKTLLCDIDPQGAATYLFRVKPKLKGGTEALIRGKRALDELIKATEFPNLDVLPADFSYRNLDLVLDQVKKPTQRLARVLEPLDGQYDRVFIDCPPSLSLASESVFRAVDVLLVPLIPTPLSVRAYDQLVRFLPDEGPRVLAFFCMVDGRKRVHKEIVEKLSDSWPGILRTHIPAASEIERMAIVRAPVFAFAPGSRAAMAFQELWREITTRMS